MAETKPDMWMRLLVMRFTSIMMLNMICRVTSHRAPRSRSDGSTSTPERGQYGLRPDWQITDTRAGGSENGISDRRSNSGGRWLAQPDRRFRAGNKLNVHFRRFSHAEHSVAIEIRVLRLPFGELGSLIQGRRKPPQSRAFHLSCGAIRMNDCSRVYDNGQFLYCDVAGRAVNPHTSGAGNPRRHIAFLPERRCDAEADILRHGTPPTCLLSSAGEHRGLPVRAAYGVRRRSGVTSGAVEQA